MNPFEMVVAIVVVVMIARVLRDRYRAQAMMPPPAQPSDDVRRIGEELARLRERVQVLERVVTDGHQTVDLDRQIDQLRDR